MAKIKSYMNPNIPKPNPGTRSSDKDGLVTKPIERRVTPTGPSEERRKGRPGPLTPRTPGKPGKRPGPLTPRTPGGPEKREKRPLPKPITKPFDLRKEKQLPRRFTSVVGKRKPAPKSKGGR